MPSYKLTYFPVKALAEPIRFILSYAGAEFEDVRFNRDDWPKIKPDTPFGQVPTLEIDGKVVPQSTSICRYLARQNGLAGKDDWEALQIDVIVDTIHDVRMKIGAYSYETNEVTKAEKLKVANEVVPFVLERLDAQVKKNGGYFVGGALTWADLTFVALLDYLNFMMKSDIIEKFDNLKQLRDKVLALPAIKAWVAKRPQSEYSDPTIVGALETKLVGSERSSIPVARERIPLKIIIMSTYKLTYFNLTGLGEGIRFLLHHCGIKFEDHRITFEEWPKYKPNMPMGQVPVLEIDGKPYAQSKAISRLIARRNNLYGSNDIDAYHIDATVDILDDVRLIFTQHFLEQDPERKEKLKKLATEKVSFCIDKLEEQVKNNGGYLVNGKLSWADILFTTFLEFFSNVLESDLLKNHPELKKLSEKVRALPRIKAYLDKRPKTTM
ncbi:glutathione S-transferase-like [Hylaeus anthracinus]|uniref:glutathione S-transferase-like n=1 Tax=Hylaeus anthracinus TaxID=313031 RepID=UPI0023B8D32A|nr:glutathione S-transferase-like [Hylaeus anthracinus]